VGGRSGGRQRVERTADVVNAELKDGAWPNDHFGTDTTERATTMRQRHVVTVDTQAQQHRQALLKAKYCPREAAASCTQKNTNKTVCPLTYDIEIQ